MIIQWYGATCIKLTTSEATIVIDPYGSETGLKLPRLTADVVATTRKNLPGSAVGAMAGGTGPFVIDGPGEYEIKKTFVYGVPIAGGSDPLTLYLIEAEGISIGHLGSLDHQLANGELERFEGVDILCIPVGGHGSLNADGAADIISAIEPRIVIPMQYKLPGLKQTLDPISVFAKEMGVKESEQVEKLKISHKDLPQDNMQVVLLKP